MKSFMGATTGLPTTAMPSARYSHNPRHRLGLGLSQNLAAKSTRNEYMAQGGFTFENNIPVLTAFGDENS